jgi:rubrerythrin
MGGWELVVEELVRELHGVRASLERLKGIEERGLRAYTETLEKLRSRQAYQSLLAVSIETMLHAKLFNALLEGLSEALRMFRRAGVRHLAAGYEDVKRYYDALRSHLEMERNMVATIAGVARQLRELEERHRGEQVETLYRLLRGVVEAIARNEAEHTAKVASILALAQG